MRNSLLLSVAIVAIYAMAVRGARTPIDINNPDVQLIGQWAVAEHDQQASERIKFNKVLRAEADEESPQGVILYLLIDAANLDGRDTKYEAVLNETASILSFKPAN